MKSKKFGFLPNLLPCNGYITIYLQAHGCKEVNISFEKRVPDLPSQKGFLENQFSETQQTILSYPVRCKSSYTPSIPVTA